MTAAILNETLKLTKDNPGTGHVVDYIGVTPPLNQGTPVIEVTAEKAQDALLRFRGERVTVLNFASGVSPGGGVWFGITAQEEELCLCSGLFHSLEQQPQFYLDNQSDEAPPECYDRMIVSEGVPLVRNGNMELVTPMMPIQVITYMAPNQYRYRQDQREEVNSVFQRRCTHVTPLHASWTRQQVGQLNSREGTGT